MERVEWGQGIIVRFPLGKSSWAGRVLDKTSFSLKGTCSVPPSLASNSLLSPCPFKLLVDLGHCLSLVGPLWPARTCVIGPFANKLSSNYPNLSVQPDFCQYADWEVDIGSNTIRLYFSLTEEFKVGTPAILEPWTLALLSSTQLCPGVLPLVGRGNKIWRNAYRCPLWATPGNGTPHTLIPCLELTHMASLISENCSRVGWEVSSSCVNRTKRKSILVRSQQFLP